MQEVKINTEFIKLDSFLKWCGAVSLGSEAKMLIMDGEVLVNGEVCTQRGKKLRVDDTVEFNGEIYKLI
ncbi:S4 domain-containing protein YaaA [Clostridium perfringens]|uniref:S4 domain-containing protein YaaA n=1 Tax=Clostridium perfringens TaxID=1502 RepID=UPI002468C2DD|nr:S4 domain-containing protein YaaA [Clostridium perfringens]MDH5078121.1 ribosome-associated protein [Clostridium perfringens]